MAAVVFRRERGGMMDFLLNWFIKGIGFGFSIIGCGLTLIAVVGVAATVAGLIGCIAEALKEDKE